MRWVFAFVSFLLLCSPGYAAGYCPNSPGGKCPTAKVTKPDSRSNYSAAQREKMREEFRLLCKKHYGAQSRLVNVDYARRKYTCSDGVYF